MQHLPRRGSALLLEASLQLHQAIGRISLLLWTLRAWMTSLRMCKSVSPPDVPFSHTPWLRPSGSQLLLLLLLRLHFW